MSLNVLVVDDSAVARTMIIRTLQMCELPLGEILQAGNGQEGLAVLEKNWVDLVLVDVNMPVMSGEEMLNAIRAQEAWKDLAVIVVSTEGSQTRIERLRSEGARFVHKPFTPELVREVVLEMTGVSHEQ